MTRTMVCIRCPFGCEMTVDVQGQDVHVTGNRCKRGVEYAREECFAPKRMVTAVVRTDSAALPWLPVKTATPVDKAVTRSVAANIHRLRVSAPVEMGQVVCEDIDGHGTRLVATRSLPLTAEAKG